MSFQREIFVILLLAFVSVNCQDFCDSFLSNGHRMIVHSQDFRWLFLIIYKYFWTLRQNENGFVFEKEDRQGTEIEFKANYSFSFTFHTKSKREKIIGFYRTDLSCKSECLHQYVLNGTVLEYWNWNYGSHSANFVAQHVKYRPSLAFAVNDGKSIGFVGQVFDEMSKEFKRNFTYIGLTINFDEQTTRKPTLHLDPPGIVYEGKIKDQLEKLETINNKIEMIGVFMNLNNETTVFLRFNDIIKYCSVDECLRENITLLIDCTKTSDSNGIGTIGWVLIGIVLIAIVVVVVALIVLIYQKSNNKYDSTVKTGTDTDQAEDSQITIKTIHSETGVPINEMTDIRSDLSIETTGKQNGKSEKFNSSLVLAKSAENVNKS